MNLRIPHIIPCEEPRWATGGHAQTLWGHFLPSPRLVHSSERLEVPLPDGDRLVARFFKGQSDLVVYLFHGLSGDIHSDYMSRTARVCLDRGHSVYLVNHRGCGEGEGLAVNPYHSGRGEDVSCMIAEGRRRFPHQRHLAIGFSLGGNALLCLLSGLRGDVLPDYAISVNAPIHLRSAATSLEHGFNRVYDTRFMWQLKNNLKRRHKKGYLKEAIRFPRFMSVRDFDNFYTAAAGGFESGDHYYESCSTFEHLSKITIPTVILTAENDPFVPYAPHYKEAKLSPTTHLHAEKTGGHMGYLTRNATPLGSKRWLDYALDQFIAALTAKLA